MRKIADTCSYLRCSRKYEARGYCTFHYGRLRSGKPLDDPKKLVAALDWPSCPKCRRRIRPTETNHDKTCRALIRAKGKAWRAKSQVWWAAYSRKYRKTHHEKYIANKKVQQAVADGRINKPGRCEDCGKAVPKKRLHGHHEDYSKPFNVNWVCDPCHKARHRAIKT